MGALAATMVAVMPALTTLTTIAIGTCWKVAPHLLSVNGAYGLVGMFYDGIIPSANSERTAPVAFEQPPGAAKKLSERSTDEGSPPRQGITPCFSLPLLRLSCHPRLAVQPTELPIWLK